MPTLDVFTFNVNQFSKPEHQKADLLERMRNTSVGLLQETVHLDVQAFLASADVVTQVGRWDGYQIHHGNNDGHANTAVIWRKRVGPATAKYLVDLGHENTRERYLTCADLPASGFGSGHIFPQRDKAGIPGQLHALHLWRRAHQGAQALGFDRNMCPPERLEVATGMKWHGVGIDGFLVSPGVKVRRVRAFPKGFSDHPGVHAQMTFPDPTPTPKQPTGGTVTVKPPAPKYLGPAAHISAGNNMPIHRVVIHSTVSPCVPGGAVSIANYFKSPSSGGSAHYVVDPSTEVQCVYDSKIAWHAPPNPNSLGIEMCDIPGPVPNDKPGSARWKALRRSWRWVQPNQQKMLARTAKLAAQLCAAYDVPVQFLTVADLKAGKHGITTHNNVSQTWHESTHWDPGWWPRRRFMRLVAAEFKTLTTKETP